ncbi:Arabinogalactan endo-beta-1,4-galactanase [Micromonospora saelicesensis]|uniref:Arabinogalactan endo-beta-1,4-galactanase n=1 Tax=Micromonospora saelicesensis TaxID=285676 RepID=A0A328NPE3_9ACTN|nr:RICIN domain-containing protein [Micromonospora saelicesensis]RAO36259.1 Arabinogalactan endo-beta-1,4-galactanase [Micromonospora saelicesensis]
MQWADNGALHQKWSIVPVGDGYHRIVNRRSGHALVIQRTATGANRQQW